MGTRLTFALWVVSCCVGLAPRAWSHSEEATVTVKTYAPITVDGKLDDWVRRLDRSDWAAQLKVKKSDVLRWIRAVPIYLNALTSKIETGNVANPEDFSAVVYTMWDPQNFYVAAVVADDQVVAQHTGEQIWQDDCLELWFDCRHDALTHTLLQEDEYQVGISPAGSPRDAPTGWAWRNPQASAVVAAMRVGSSLTSNGYIVEASIPWAVLHGCQPTIGSMIGFNLSAVDVDKGKPWTHVTWSGELHSDPSQFGHLYFLDAPIDLFPADVFEQPAQQAPWEPSKERTP